MLSFRLRHHDARTGLQVTVGNGPQTLVEILPWTTYPAWSAPTFTPTLLGRLTLRLLDESRVQLSWPDERHQIAWYVLPIADYRRALRELATDRLEIQLHVPLVSLCTLVLHGATERSYTFQLDALQRSLVDHDLTTVDGVVGCLEDFDPWVTTVIADRLQLQIGEQVWVLAPAQVAEQFQSLC